eukprot:CAMPEP_0172715076 /NCGR_PEP_ID=MMETSP1074-20121228/67335_1 /TAXON_ID=2916 /ORGANISM="Ceratium fusus, Strain PA161109" /LENGTH=456 /DNA_ID=CAMNT_0013539613 /DNA_START=6 /DNA_END=1376 /DNA_ORIENTATION=+
MSQLVVMSPQYLVQHFSPSRGAIEGSTATFGAPFYGDRVLGKLVYGKSTKNKNYCDTDDYDFGPDQPAPSGSYKDVRLINIVLVKRGGCSFTQKVRVAVEKGAHAVVIVDKPESTLTAKDLRNIIVADDGFGGNIKIPSILISKEDGKHLLDAVEQKSQVVVELAWNLPTNKVVQLDLWMSSASQESLKFLRDFAKTRRTLNDVMSFQPHYAVFSMAKGDPSVSGGLCLDSTGKFCAEDPDGAGPRTGKDVLMENVRQLCLHETYKKKRQTRDVNLEGATEVWYAQEFWNYIEKLLERCPLDKFGEECSKALMQEVGVDYAKISSCVDQTLDAKLEYEREHSAWSPRALRINGWRYSGILEPDLVTRAICSGFSVQPKECSDLIKPRDPFVPFAAQQEGVSFGTLLAWLLGTLVLAFVALLVYKRFLKKEMRATLREEVMLEVQAQMGEYRKMQGN